MGLLFLILFAMLEILLMVLTFAKGNEKSKFLKNQTVVIFVELLILLFIVLLPVTYMKWRFACALAVLAIRLAVSGMRFLVKSRKVQGNVRKPARIVCSAMAVVIMSFSLVPSFVFANYNGIEVTGKYEINKCSAILVDHNRSDEFESDGSSREVPVHFYYPDKDGEFPLVIFSHGAFGYYQSNYSTYAELASNGYVVVALDHPHHAFFTKDTNGKMVIVDTEFITNVARFSNFDGVSNDEAFALSQEWMELRTDDMNFVLDTIKNAKKNEKLDKAFYAKNEADVLNVISKTNIDKIGLMGHSMGGATAEALGRERTDIDAVIVLDGSMLTEIKSVKNGEFEYTSQPYPTPLLDFRKESDYNEIEQLSKDDTFTKSYAYGFTYVNNYIVENAKNGRLVVFKNAGHMNFTDLPMFSHFLSSMLGTGETDSEQFMCTVNEVTLNWFNYYLKDEGSLNIKATY